VGVPKDRVCGRPLNQTVIASPALLVPPPVSTATFGAGAIKV
jgi:hypothetical protein